MNADKEASMDKYSEVAKRIAKKFKHCSNCNPSDTCYGSPGLEKRIESAIKSAVEAERKRCLGVLKKMDDEFQSIYLRRAIELIRTGGVK